MMLTTHQWILAFATALATHAMAVVVLPQAMSKRQNAPSSPKPVLVSLATAPALPTPTAAPPAPVRPTPPPVARQPEPAPAPATVESAPVPQQSVAAINLAPVAPQPQPLESTVDDDTSPTTTEPAPSRPPTTAVAPTPVLEVADADLAQLRSQYGKAAQRLLNSHKRYPERAKYRREEGIVLVSFVVNLRGEVLEAKVERSSGKPLLDREALAAIRRAQPLPVFPEELANVNETITIRVPIQFQLR